MEATREERQQMRQRGAGTRKAKEVNFGFSFGSPLAEPSAPAPLAIVPEPRNPPQTQPAPATTPPPLKASQTISQGPKAGRTPGSARNQLPERPSTYDILSDDRGEQMQSNKRRKLSPKKNTKYTHIRQSGVPPENGDAQSANGSASNTEARTNHTADTPYMPALEQQEEHRNGSPQPLISPIPETSSEDQHQGDIGPGANSMEPATVLSNSTVEELSLRGNSQVSGGANAATLEEARISPVSPKALQPQSQTEAIQLESAERLSEQRIQRNKRGVSTVAQQTDNSITKGTQRESSAEALKADHAPTVDSDVEMTEGISELNNEIMAEDDQVSQEPSANTKKPRGRPGRKATATQSSELPAGNSMQEPVTETQEEPTAAQTEVVSNPKRPRGRPSLNKKAIQVTETEEVSSEPVPNVGEASSGTRRGRKPVSANPGEQQEPVVESGALKPQRGRPGKKTRPLTDPAPDLEPEVETEVRKPQRGRPANKSKRAVDPEEPQAEEPAEVRTEATVPKPRRGRPGKKAKHAVEPEAEIEPVEEDQPEEDQPEPAVESAAPKPQRGRPGKAKRTTEPAPEPESETELQPEVESAQNEPRRKAREPRGETVPVTVYRLANVSSLGGTVSTADEPGDDQDSADELNTNQRTKMPNRGGVNPADVLSQICRETLEKTLNTLKDGIANEANATRRAEWSRKRKAVETFGSELDSRLMDLSGMLDSNFVLGVQLKKTKRDMMDLRGHLYRVRRERESVALQMDTVRSKHIEEEKAKTSRTNINNSLHSLELALDRNKQRPTSAADPSPADLEFMLRTVADVSARAPGSQGGLLNQIRAFNAQLEATASRLER